MWRKFLICYIVLLVSFTSLVILAHLIPTKLLVCNIHQSAQKIEYEGIFRQIGNIYLLQIDNMTDCMMLNMAATADEHHPVESALNNYYSCNSVDEGYKNMALNTIQLTEKGRESLPERIHYGRYWQGIQVLLRPLLIVADYSTIRIINYILLTALLLSLLWLIYSHFGGIVSIIFLASLLLVSAPIVPLSIQLSVCFYLMLLYSIYIIKLKNTDNVYLVFFVMGAITSYFDFLTVPQITLGIPLTFFLLKNKVYNTCKYVVLLSLSWLGGYALLWSSKWVIAYLLIGNEIMDTVTSSISLRLSDSIVFHGVEIGINDLVFLLLSKIRWWMILILLSIMVFISLIYYRLQKGKTIIYRYSWLLLIALIVPIWFIVLRNHSIQHIFFTWRALLVPLFSMLLFIYYTTRKEKNYES